MKLPERLHRNEGSDCVWRDEGGQGTLVAETYGEPDLAAEFVRRYNAEPKLREALVNARNWLSMSHFNGGKALTFAADMEKIDALLANKEPQKEEPAP